MSYINFFKQKADKIVEKNNNNTSKLLVDTNVLLFTGRVEDNYIVCSIVAEELEKHKCGFQSKNRNSRSSLRHLLNNSDCCIESSNKGETNDDKIIATAKENNLKLLTNDVAMIVKARIKGVDTHYFIPDKTENNEVTYEGLNYNLNSNTNQEEAWGLRPRNNEQQKVLNAILDDNISMVSIIGKAGSGKTILSLAAALELVDQNKADSIIIVRKIVDVGGNDIGFLPGSKEDKLGGSAGAIFDNLNILTRSKKNTQQLMETGLIELENIGSIRGRSLENKIIILDEAQNTTLHEVKTVLTRAGERSKIILMGDTQQIDTPNLSELDNGLALVSHAFQDSCLASSIVLKKCFRSKLAHEAVEKL